MEAKQGLLKTPWRYGTSYLLMSPLEFMQRLAALVPRPRLHLMRFHGVLAPIAKLRARVLPQEPEAPTQATLPVECETNCAHRRLVRLSWAKLLKRVFDFDIEHCPNCSGDLKIIAASLEQPVIEKMRCGADLQGRLERLDHGLPHRGLTQLRTAGGEPARRRPPNGGRKYDRVLIEWRHGELMEGQQDRVRDCRRHP